MIHFRPTEPGDLPGLSTLFASRFGHPWTLEEWQWKYRHLPGEGRSWVAVRGDGGVVAHAGAIRLPARWQDGEGGVWQLTDWVGSTGGGGLRAALVGLGQELLAELPRPGEAPWVFGFPSERHFRLGEHTFGYLPLDRFPVLTGEIADAAEAAAGAPEVEVAISDHCEGSWTEELWRGLGVLGVVRSAAFLNWRYWSRPGRYYRFYRVRGAGGEGLAVFAFVGAWALAAETWLPAGRGLDGALPAIAADLAATGLSRWRFWPHPHLGGEPARLGLVPGEEVFVGCRGRVGEPDPRPHAVGFLTCQGDHDVV
ncbi:MAG TPA: hypothetical protein VF017_05780 [Thermoanaerobaculia bacterium]|nr:hypothetical protein [Thermoanaerobaculia bacterium]